MVRRHEVREHGRSTGSRVRRHLRGDEDPRDRHAAATPHQRYVLVKFNEMLGTETFVNSFASYDDALCAMRGHMGDPKQTRRFTGYRVRDGTGEFTTVESRGEA